ncbi:MAG TPA: BMC domain-containing protein [Acidimicrobiia bacterium]|nr:BMC domain-containing protein [Acidimicrobiia bacterium]
MSELDSAIALFEFESISAGIVAGDAMVKTAPLGAIYAGSAHPGKYLVLVTGDTASVDEAVQVGNGVESLSDMVFLPDVHPAVADAVTGNISLATVGDEALGVVETTTVAAAIDAADAGAKAAEVHLAAIRLADGLGGKGYVLFSGVVAQVEAALTAAVERANGHGALVRSDLIAQLHEEMAENLRAELRFLSRLSAPLSSGGE